MKPASNPEDECGCTFIPSIASGLVKGVREFCRETSMHGFNHIAAPKRIWIERLLWACATGLAIWGAVDISLGQWQRFNENPTVVTLEKNFRTWTYHVPAITICYTNRVDPVKLDKLVMELFSVSPGSEQYEYYKRFVETVANSNLLNLSGYDDFIVDDTLKNFDTDLYDIAFKVMPDLSVKTTWSAGYSPKWWPVMTEMGACYATNSLALADTAIIKPSINDTKDFPLGCKYENLLCYVIAESTVKTEILCYTVTFTAYDLHNRYPINNNLYIHSPYDIADTLSPPCRMFPTLNRIVELTVMETQCGKGVRGLTPQRRRCLYNDEPTNHWKQVYSTNTCRQECRNKIAIEFCKCQPFYYAHLQGGEAPICNVVGMACLISRFTKLTPQTTCPCSQQCVDSVFRELSVEDQYWEKGPFALRGAVRYSVQAPRTRYTREIVFHFQDLVVSFGGAAGLFLGASFISFVEIFYFIVSRFLGMCIHEKKEPNGKVKEHINNKSYEEERIRKLTSILEDQEKHNYFKMYPY